MRSGRSRIFFAADIHGSDRCFRKWLNAARVYEADALVFGGDIAGKVVVPIVQLNGARYAAELHGKPVEVSGGAELEALRSRIRASGRYDVVVSPEEKAAYDADPGRVAGELFPRVARETVRLWVEMAEERLAKSGVPAYVMLGNDDYPELEPLLQGELVQDVDGRTVELPGGYEMISFGYSNRTPWNTPRELDEPDIWARVETMASSLREPEWSVFNFHCPPHRTHLDVAAMLDADFRPIVEGGQVKLGNVGSTAVREAEDRYQPMLGLHGHIHESPGAHRLGRTLAINPGSEYGDGILRGVLVTLDRKRGVRSWQFVQG